MPLQIGSEIEGNVTGITNYGAFIEMPEGCSGLVHISQVADAYVTDISKHIKIGDLIKVKIMGMAKEGKYDLSIKQVGKQAWQQPRRKTREEKEMAEPGSFEDKVTQFLKQSDEKLQDWKRNLENKQGGGRKKF